MEIFISAMCLLGWAWATYLAIQLQRAQRMRELDQQFMRRMRGNLDETIEKLEARAQADCGCCFTKADRIKRGANNGEDQKEI